MPTFDVTVQLRGPLSEPGILARFDREIQATLAEIGALGQRLIVGRTPRGISSGGGGLRGSSFTECGTPARREQIIGFSAFYAPIVEAGRQPGRRPPIAPIELWVRRKLGVPANKAASVAFLVARKIGARGTVGARMVAQTVPQLAQVAQQRFDALGQRIAAALGRQG